MFSGGLIRGLKGGKIHQSEKKKHNTAVRPRRVGGVKTVGGWGDEASLEKKVKGGRERKVERHQKAAGV